MKRYRPDHKKLLSGMTESPKGEYVKYDDVKHFIDETSFSDLVENYLSRASIGESYFGVQACGNSMFVKRLRSGGKFHAETVEKVRRYIADNPAP